MVAFHAYQLMYIEKLPDESHDAGIRLLFSSRDDQQSRAAAVMVFFVLSGYLVGGPAIVRMDRASRCHRLFFRPHGPSLCRAHSSIDDCILRLCVCEAIIGLGSIRGLASGSVRPRANPLRANRAVWCNLQRPVSANDQSARNSQPICRSGACPTNSGTTSSSSRCCRLSESRPSRSPLSESSDCSCSQSTMTGGNAYWVAVLLHFAIWSLGALVYAVTMPIARWIVLVAGSLILLHIAEIFGFAPRWAVTEFTIGLGTAAAIIGLSHFQVPLPSFLNFGKTLAKFSFSLYAIHYPILLFLHVIIGGRYEFTLASFVLNICFRAGLRAGRLRFLSAVRAPYTRGACVA